MDATEPTDLEHNTGEMLVVLLALRMLINANPDVKAELQKAHLLQTLMESLVQDGAPPGIGIAAQTTLAKLLRPLARNSRA